MPTGNGADTVYVSMVFTAVNDGGGVNIGGDKLYLSLFITTITRAGDGGDQWWAVGDNG